MVKAWVVAAALGLMPVAAMAQNRVDVNAGRGGDVSVRTDRRTDVNYDRGGTEVRYRDRAADESGAGQGAWELRLSGAGSNDNDFNNGGFSVGADIGYYLTDAWEVGVRQNFTFATSDSAGSSWTGATRVFLDYNFNAWGKIVPFVGANVGYLYGEDTDSSWIAAPEAGIKWYVKPETFLFFQAEYQWPVQDRFEDGVFVYSLGFGINWR
jgi:hypothetical protein